MYTLVPTHIPQAMSRAMPRAAHEGPSAGPHEGSSAGGLLCYHGNRVHLQTALELWGALCSLRHAAGAPTIRVLAIVSNASGAGDALPSVSGSAGCTGVVVEERIYRGVDDTYAQLSRCDLGLVPNLEDPASAHKANTREGTPTVTLRYKTSANGGRAMVMAQVGLPFVGSPELEAAQLVGAAGLPADRVFAATTDQWLHRLRAWLYDAGARAHASKALRAYAERELLPSTFARLVERRILQARKARHDRLRAAGLAALQRDAEASASVQERIDVCYCLEGAGSAERLERSMRSIARAAAEPHRLRFPLFVGNASALSGTLHRLQREVPHALHGMRVYADAFANVSKHRAAALPKLRTRANYMRFYLPRALRHLVGVVKLLYLDVDTIALHDIAPLYDSALATSRHAVAAGAQTSKRCTLRRVFNFSDARVLAAKPADMPVATWRARLCLTASVLITHIKRWHERRLTRAVEGWMQRNVEGAQHVDAARARLAVAARLDAPSHLGPA